MLQQQGGGGGGGRGRGLASPQQSQQGGRSSGFYQCHGGRPQYHGVAPHQTGPPSEYESHSGPQTRAPQQHFGGCSQTSGHGGAPAAGPSRPTVPELHQATKAPCQATEPSLPEASSSSQTLYVSLAQVVLQLEHLAVQGQASSSHAIQPAASSSKSMRFPLCPRKGSYGVKCIVKAYHFFAQLPNKDLHQYDVSISPDATSRGVNRAVKGELVRLHRESHLGGRLPAYDGRKSLYTAAGPLPFTSKNFEITLYGEEDGLGGQRRERLFKVVIKFAACADLHCMELFLAGRQADAPQEALQVLDIVLRELPTARYAPVGRSFYSANLGRPHPLGEGLESWHGFYQSIHPTQMGLSLNIDMSSTAFIEPLPVIDFVVQLLNRDVSARPLSDADCVKIKKALRGMKVEVTHRGNMHRKYRNSGLTSQAARELMFPVDDRGTMKSVVQYFQETYGFNFQHTMWPCLQVGNQQRPDYLPLEVCKIVEGQRYLKRLNEKQITALLRVTCQRPKQRELEIIQTVKQNAYHDDPYAKEFGIIIDERLALVEARILPAPWIMVNDGRVSNWTRIKFSHVVHDNAARDFCHQLAAMCHVSGMVGGRNTVLMDAWTRRIPLVSDTTTIIFGADVTHPHPGEDSSPSIAAVVASQDWPEITKYAGLVGAQAHQQELIRDLFKVWQDPQRGAVAGGMIMELLISFKKATGQNPQRLIFYRDGVSEGQFYQVLLYEFDAIRKTPVMCLFRVQL